MSPAYDQRAWRCSAVDCWFVLIIYCGVSDYNNLLSYLALPYILRSQLVILPSGLPLSLMLWQCQIWSSLVWFWKRIHWVIQKSSLTRWSTWVYRLRQNHIILSSRASPKKRCFTACQEVTVGLSKGRTCKLVGLNCQCDSPQESHSIWLTTTVMHLGFMDPKYVVSVSAWAYCLDNSFIPAQFMVIIRL